MTAFTFRPQTMDFAIFNMVYFNNEYQLPDRFAPDDVIIDVGAHIGSFAFAVLVRGAGKVISIEAHPENYQLAQQHLEGYIKQGRLDLKWGAVWRSDENDDSLSYSDFPKLSDNLTNTGNVEVQVNQDAQPIPRFALDNLLAQVAAQPVRLLKLDCEGSEFPILLTSDRLNLVDEIVGEFHEVGGDYDRFETPISLPHFQRFTIDVLLEYLQAQGFATRYQRHQRYDAGEWTPLPIGYFRAQRFDSL